MKQVELDEYYLKVAELTANLSRAKRRKVGAVLVKDDSIISFGFNGTPSGFDNNCEYNACSMRGTCIKSTCVGCDNYNLRTKPEVLHAESNAITKCAKHGRSTIGSTLYVTCEPCIECAKLIIQAGIHRVVYVDSYHTHEGLELLKKVSNIRVVQYAKDPESNLDPFGFKIGSDENKKCFNLIESIIKKSVSAYNCYYELIANINELLGIIYNTSQPEYLIEKISTDSRGQLSEVIIKVPVHPSLPTIISGINWIGSDSVTGKTDSKG